MARALGSTNLSGPAAAGHDIEIRQAGPDDHAAVLALMRDSLGWPGDDQAAYFRWKHVENPFGPSPAWVATNDGEVVGYRALLRWNLRAGERLHRAVRAVDTVTRADQRRKGLFSRLTTAALAELPGEGIDLVFNTPNDASRPGYLKMGWQVVGRLPVYLRPRSLATLARVARARVPADLSSLPSGAGRPAPEVLADRAGVARLLASQPTSELLRTERSPEFLAWRYGFGPLAYRAVLAGNQVEEGLALYRLRRRGPAVEAAVCDVLVPGGNLGARRRLWRQVASDGLADHAVVMARPAGRPLAAGFVPAPVGPVLTFRAVGAVTPAGPPPLTSWDLCLGDIELF